MKQQLPSSGTPLRIPWHAKWAGTVLSLDRVGPFFFPGNFLHKGRVANAPTVVTVGVVVSVSELRAPKPVWPILIKFFRSHDTFPLLGFSLLSTIPSLNIVLWGLKNKKHCKLFFFGWCSGQPSPAAYNFLGVIYLWLIIIETDMIIRGRPSTDRPTDTFRNKLCRGRRCSIIQKILSKWFIRPRVFINNGNLMLPLPKSRAGLYLSNHWELHPSRNKTVQEPQVFHHQIIPSKGCSSGPESFH